VQINFYLPRRAIVGGLAVLMLALMLVGGGSTLAQNNSRTFPETGKTVSGRFLQYWSENGGLRQQGYPISDPITEVSDLNGQSYTVQYFERAEFEAHPENATPNDVLLSQLGTFRYRAKYSGGGQPQPTAPATATTNTLTVSLVIAYSNVSRGDQQEMTVNTTPGAKVEVSCSYTGGRLATGCINRSGGFANANGNYDINWTIEADAPLGPVIVDILVSKDGKTAGARGKFAVR